MLDHGDNAARELFDVMPELGWAASPDGSIHFYNRAFYDYTGRTFEEMRGRGWYVLVEPSFLPSASAAWDEALRQRTELETELPLRGRGGQFRWFLTRVRPIMDASGAIVRWVGVATDVDELQRRAFVAERMIAVGTIAASVAHEINNPLTYVGANLEMALEAVRELGSNVSSPRINELENMVLDAREGADRVRNIVRGLRDSSRADNERRAVIDVEPVLERAIHMVSNEIRHRAKLVRDHRHAPFVIADEARLGQVFINLLVNAAQAIPEGNAATNEIRVVTYSDGAGRAVIEVHDTGAGIPDEVSAHIFDAFFTTKADGAGTGLGLSISHDTIRRLGGELTMSTEVGVGTVFRVALPAAALQELTRAPASAKTPSVGSRRASVLVIDDEAGVGVAVRRALVEHDVKVVTTAEQALDLLAAGARFDVLLCDLMMPQMTGAAFYEELLRTAPADAGRLVLMTAGAFTPAARELVDRVRNERLEKPFTLDALRALVRKVLEETS
jgi:PAS domain S-box-containing protein